MTRYYIGDPSFINDDFRRFHLLKTYEVDKDSVEAKVYNVDVKNMETVLLQLPSRMLCFTNIDDDEYELDQYGIVKTFKKMPKFEYKDGIVTIWIDSFSLFIDTN